ncbi:MAG: TIGR04211 family SH3 domain-containing protein [Deltaproteobacteria bacterium]|nr:TIGR04211 family SH3 domain-containing protein [Deltaproteobacteria bacterium]
MKYFIAIVMSLFFLSVTVHAETRYISNIIKITLRTGPGITHKIVQMIKSGQRVEIKEQGDEWSRVGLPNGKEGWVLNRFLVEKEPDFIALAKLKKKYNTISVKMPKIITENKQFKEENKKLKQNLDKHQSESSNLAKEYDKLKDASAGYLDLKVKYEKTVVKLAEQSDKADRLEKELLHKYITAGLTGAAVLLLGFIIGFSTKRQRKRTSLL